MYTAAARVRHRGFRWKLHWLVAMLTSVLFWGHTSNSFPPNHPTGSRTSASSLYQSVSWFWHFSQSVTFHGGLSNWDYSARSTILWTLFHDFTLCVVVIRDLYFFQLPLLYCFQLFVLSFWHFYMLYMYIVKRPTAGYQFCCHLCKSFLASVWGLFEKNSYLSEENIILMREKLALRRKRTDTSASVFSFILSKIWMFPCLGTRTAKLVSTWVELVCKSFVMTGSDAHSWVETTFYRRYWNNGNYNISHVIASFGHCLFSVSGPDALNSLSRDLWCIPIDSTFTYHLMAEIFYKADV